MKILKKDLKHGEVSVKITDEEDLWHLSHIINPRDIIRGKTERKIKIGSDENAKSVRKTIYAVVEAEKIEYEPENKSLRILGKIKEGSEDAPLGSYHSFNLEESETITIVKEKWAGYELDRLHEAEMPKTVSLLVLFDREDAIICFLTRKGYQKVAELKGDVQKKADEEKKKGDFYKEICSKITECEKRVNVNNIIVASPAFWKDYLLAEFSEEMRKKTITATISDVSDSAINELMKRPELSKTLDTLRSAQELKEIEELMKAIKENKAFYGLEDAKEKIFSGTVEKMLVSEKFLKQNKEKEKYEEIDSLLVSAENMKAKIFIITSEEPCQKLDSLGGIAGITRWKI
ncbi:MAG: mRNA surveillance protein pelota [Candidatus Nanoarchaeia archaeon]